MPKFMCLWPDLPEEMPAEDDDAWLDLDRPTIAQMLDGVDVNEAPDEIEARTAKQAAEAFAGLEEFLLMEGPQCLLVCPSGSQGDFNKWQLFRTTVVAVARRIL